ncbi:MAG: hypothetical protein ABR923_04525 [Terracidiphilus sp.]|jgi:hypothetical protein
MRLQRAFVSLELWAVVFFAIFLSAAARAQQYANQEVTVGVDSQTFGAMICTVIGSGPLCQPGHDHYLSYPVPSATYTYNLSPSLALEGTVVPTSQFRYANDYGSGRETLAMGGVKTGWRGNKWGFYGEVQAGIGSFSCSVYTSAPDPYSNCQRVTNFALEYGGVVERRIARRWALRVDAGHLMMPEFDRIDVRYTDGSPYISQSAEWLQHLDMRIGITRSFGELHEAKPEPVPTRSAWDLGATFALQPRAFPEWPFMNAYPSWGLWGSWNFSRHVSWDSAILHEPRNSGLEFIDFQAGGRAFEALTGVKVGIRRDHMGYFAKARGGTITFGKTEQQLYSLPDKSIGEDYGMFTNPVLDVGGVYEVYPSRHTILRVDAGSATIFYQPKNVISFGQTVPIPGRTQTGMLMSFGAGFRF